MTAAAGASRRARRGVAAAAALTLAALLAGTLAAPASAAAPVALAAPVAGSSARPSPGAPGIGDPLYPGLGNGGYQVVHYDLSLRYATITRPQRLNGSVSIAAIALQSLSRFNLDFSGGAVGSVTVNGRRATFARAGDELVVTPSRPLARGRAFVVTVSRFSSAATVPDPSSFLSTVFVQTPDGTVWSGQPNGMHKIFPCNDHPQDKASFSFRVDVPSGTTAVANGVLVGKNTRGKRTIWRYEQREPMATELAQLAVGAYTVIPRGRRSGVVVRDVVPTRLLTTTSLRSQLGVVGGQLDWMERKVGPYPFRTYGSLIADAQLGFALETQTLSLYDKVFFTRPQGLWDPVMVHELAHQWFGDSVAPTRWGDIWQNEGHATWYEFTYAAEKGFLADDTGIADFTELMRTIYSVGDEWRATYGPVGAPLSGKPDSLFNINVYYGGALVLYALRQKIGDAAFQRVERAWVSLYRGRSASTADYIALASKVSGQNVGPFLRAWLYGNRTPPMPGHPDWAVEPGSGKSSMDGEWQRQLKPLAHR